MKKKKKSKKKKEPKESEEFFTFLSKLYLSLTIKNFDEKMKEEKNALITGIKKTMKESYRRNNLYNFFYEGLIINYIVNGGVIKIGERLGIDVEEGKAFNLENLLEEEIRKEEIEKRIKIPDLLLAIKNETTIYFIPADIKNGKTLNEEQISKKNLLKLIPYLLKNKEIVNYLKNFGSEVKIVIKTKKGKEEYIYKIEEPNYKGTTEGFNYEEIKEKIKYAKKVIASIVKHREFESKFKIKISDGFFIYFNGKGTKRKMKEDNRKICINKEIKEFYKAKKKEWMIKEVKKYKKKLENIRNSHSNLYQFLISLLN